jgi:2-keto-4-pentenoate hydratase/2-oxohepta-3-ene-1,7-dioic acid hydratase in catechol pathway
MKMKRIHIKGDSSPSIAVFSHDGWLSFRLVLGKSGRVLTEDEDRMTRDMVALLQADSDSWQSWAGLIEAYVSDNREHSVSWDDSPVLPFQPLSYRDFMLFEKHAIDAGRGYAKRFIPSGYRLASWYEKITGKTFPPFRPKRIWYEKPIYYMGNHLSFVTNGRQIAFPSYSRALDYELELGAVLAKPVKDASPEEALYAIGGFVVFNDFSARDIQLSEMKSGFGPVKAKHFANAVSNVLVSADEILPYLSNLQAEVRINGQCIVRTSTEGMYHSLGEAIAYASLNEQLYPGEFFATGTLPGGSGMENGHWLKSGDTIELWIERIGILTNTIA